MYLMNIRKDNSLIDIQRIGLFNVVSDIYHKEYSTIKNNEINLVGEYSTIGFDSTYNKKLKIESNGLINLDKQEDTLYKVKWINFLENSEEIIDTIVAADFLFKNIEALYALNYPLLDVSESSKDYFHAVNDSLKVSITAVPFDSTAHTYTIDSAYHIYEKIDGHKIWGADGGLPRQEIKAIDIKLRDKSIKVSNENFQDLYEPSLNCGNAKSRMSCHTKVYVLPNNSIVLSMLNSDGAGGYTLLLQIDLIEGKVIRRIIGNGF